MKEDIQLAEKLLKDGTFTEDSFKKIKSHFEGRLFSIGFELRILLSVGVLLLSTGLGVLIYKNIDSIGHMAVILFIAALSLSCLGYCYKKRMPYSNEKVNSPNMLFDYILLLGCLTFSTFTVYLQYEYSVFGDWNGLAMLLPAILFFALAYYFDHIGVLSLAITCLAAFAGITITPIKLLQSNDFSSENIIFTGLAIGSLLAAAGIYLPKYNIKKHFKFTYFNFATHLIFVSCLAGMFVLDAWIVFALLLAGITFISYRHALMEKSFYFLIFTVLYGYIGLSYFVCRVLYNLIREGGALVIYMGFIYITGSSVGVILFLIRYNRKMKKNAHI